jgi:dipicolinate synthase subunit B
VEELCARPVIHTIADAEPLGPRTPLEALIISPCTGNTLAKLAQGITDSAVTMAVKAHLRQDRPLLIALASNDGLSQNLANLSTLLGRKSVYFVPMLQDDPRSKPHSLVADFSLLPEALDAMQRGEQMRPLFLLPK